MSKQYILDEIWTLTKIKLKYNSSMKKLDIYMGEETIHPDIRKYSYKKLALTSFSIDSISVSIFEGIS